MNQTVRLSHVKSSICRSILLLSCLAVAFHFTTSIADAQSTAGRIRGTVTDPSGGAIAGATVLLINEGTNSTREAKTGATGEYLFLEVPVGSYEIDVNQQGSRNMPARELCWSLNEIASVDIPLQVGSNVDTVEVTGAPPTIDTTTTHWAR